jgi:hypothetical protein
VSITVSFEQFYAEVLPFVPSCPDIVALNAIRNAAIDFCGSSHAWQQDVDPIGLSADEGDYDIDIPTHADVADIAFVTVGGRDIQPKSADELTGMFGTDWRDRTGSPVFYNKLAQDDAMTLVPKPDVNFVATGATLNVRVVLTPTRTTTVCDTAIYNAWLEPIAAGAKARLFLMTGQSYYNPVASAMNLSAFRRGIHEAAVARNKSNVRSDLRVAFRKNF